MSRPVNIDGTWPVAEPRFKIGERCRHGLLARSCGYCEVEDEIAELRAKVAELERDAARYRWVRTHGAWESETGLDILSENPEDYEAAVDLWMRDA